MELRYKNGEIVVKGEVFMWFVIIVFAFIIYILGSYTLLDRILGPNMDKPIRDIIWLKKEGLPIKTPLPEKKHRRPLTEEEWITITSATYPIDKD